MFDAPIVAVQYEGKKCYYRYSDPNFSIFKNELSDEDLTKLRSTIEMLGRYRGDPENAWLEEVIFNLEYRFGVKGNSENLVSFGQNEQLKGLEYLSEIIDSTVNHQPLEINYKAYYDKELIYMLHPYYVKQYNGRWFFIGYDSISGIMPNIALDRILNMRKATIEFVKNDSVDFKTHLNDVIGVSIPNDDVKKEPIVLRFTKERFSYVVSKPIHHSQRILENQEYEVEINVRPNRELYQHIFSFIPDVEVVSPLWFRNDIKNKIKKNIKNYFTV